MLMNVFRLLGDIMIISLTCFVPFDRNIFWIFYFVLVIILSRLLLTIGISHFISWQIVVWYQFIFFQIQLILDFCSGKVENGEKAVEIP